MNATLGKRTKTFQPQPSNGRAWLILMAFLIIPVVIATLFLFLLSFAYFLVWLKARLWRWHTG